MQSTKLNILLVKLSSIGDIVFATPSMHALRAHWPNARIVVGTVNVLDAASGREYVLDGIDGDLAISAIGGPFGFTGGGNDTHQVYLSGVPAHRLKDQNVVDHLVGLVEKKAAEIEAAKLAAAESALEPAQ